MKNKILILTLLLNFTGTAFASGVYKNFGFSCKSSDKKISILISGAGLGPDGHPSDLNASRNVEINYKDRLNSKSEASCEFLDDFVNCNGEKMSLIIDLTTLRQHHSAWDIFTDVHDQVDADGKAKISLKKFLSEKEIETDLICVLSKS